MFTGDSAMCSLTNPMHSCDRPDWAEYPDEHHA